ncbi:uncharacterized protein LY89DRAFT_619393 [Mollisia scopiformis]|uniref:Uncharacterized protein n=1 Tax=Mollisia scopiformis TaxID=149040 RepID=A0A194X5L1_MOLSC|nr:uncharacterized protein LY89DRAFT_619393 [Mollisia scopiformis]KUJ15461.1 hypothetical protein LY89DRAFT_619393 [Mollisia scopiformis]
MRGLSIAGVVFGLAALASVSSAMTLSAAAQDLFDYCMSIQDPRWDETYNVVWFNDNGPWSIRFTAWYTAGLLHRNQGHDVENAKAALKAILAVQMNYDFDSAWYGDFKLSPDEPNPQTPLYTPSIYNTYDPNWREFIGTQLVQVVEEFEELIGPGLVSDIETAMAYDAVGAMRRNGSFPEGDNLILAYSNPRYMRALNVGWIGARLNNQTFIDFGNDQGTMLYELFTKNGANTLGEYNAPTYYGMDMWAMASMAKYGPKNATFTENAKKIMALVWEDIAEHYNPYLGNMAGPYDRAYTRDMTTHDAVLSMFWWGICGHDKAPTPPKSDLDLNYDVSQGAALALIMDTVASTFSPDVITKLTTPFTTERFLNKTIYYDLDTNNSRTATSWLSKPLMIGAQIVSETVNRGQQFTPAIVHWASDPSHKPFPYNGFFSLYPTASTISATASSHYLEISYPNTTQDGTDSFQFMLSGIPPPWNLAGNVVDGFTHLPCLNVTVEAPGLERLDTVYGSMIYDHYYYNITYVVPGNFSGTPWMGFEFVYTC